MVSDCVAVTPSESVTSTVKVFVEALLATVPLMTPVEALRASPLGSVPVGIDHV